MNQGLYIDKLSVGYNRKSIVLQDISLEVKQGDLILVIGENGAGKSTLLKTLGAILAPIHGVLNFEGIAIEKWNAKALAQKIAYVDASASAGQLMTAREFIAFGRYPYSNWILTKSEEEEALIEDVIVECEMTHLADKYLDEMSDGEKQKVMIARALVQETSLLILDEPTTHLDIKNTNSIFKLLQQQQVKKNKTILFSSHQVEKALKIATKIWLVHKGKVIESTVENFQNTPELKAIVFGEEDF